MLEREEKRVSHSEKKDKKNKLRIVDRSVSAQIYSGKGPDAKVSELAVIKFKSLSDFRIYATRK